MTDVAVIGAGLIGLATALELAKRGAAVSVFDRAEPAKAASWAGAGMLAPYSEAPEDAAMRSLCAAGLDHYPAFVADVQARSGIDPAFRRDGTLHAAFDEDELQKLAQSSAALARQGIGARLLDRRAALALEPMLDARLLGATLIEDEAQVDNRRLGRALRAACEAAGVALELAAETVAVEADRRRVRGLRSGRGFHPAGVVVNAAGAWAGELAGVPAFARVPVRPRKGQMLALSVPRMLARRVVWGAGVYLVPRSDGRLLVGATVEDEGFDTRVTAGGLHALLAKALRAAPALGGFTVSETWAGLRPGSPDGRPYLGATPLEGYFVATGHFRNGILLAPLTARLVADAIEGRAPSLPLAPFAVTRGAPAAAAS